MLTLETANETRRNTSADEVFRQLKSDIISLRLVPGSKISEVEVAKACDVSRQPVREAFMRLGELNLLQIRPQKATRVRKISHQDLCNTRFIRAAVEVEVVRMACKVATPQTLGPIGENLALQKVAVETSDATMLHDLDYQFHKLICAAADCLPAFHVIAENKTHTDRVCMLELADVSGMAEVLDGHSEIFDAIVARDVDVAVAKTRHHLAHLDDTLKRASENYPDFFES
ncbi:MAG: GntR family transcriptional regulator [Sulfitobacter sp.]